MLIATIFLQNLEIDAFARLKHFVRATSITYM